MKAPAVFLASVLVASGVATAQQHTVSVQPQYGSDKRDFNSDGPTSYAGYDPFHLDWSSGQFVWVPRPYESFDIHGPYRFNPSSGRFDYMPVAAPQPQDYWPTRERGGGNASNYVEARVNVQSTPITPGPSMMTTAPPQEPAVQAWTVNVPPAPKSPTTKPAAAKAWQAAARAQIKGRWEFNAETGRWRCVLPGDQ